MKKIIILPALMVLFGITAYFFIIPDDELNNDESKYTNISVQRKDLSQSVIATGIVKPKVGAEVKVGAQVSGIVKELFVDIGSKVKKNQLLAVIEPDVYKAKSDLALGVKEEIEIERRFAEIELNRSKSLHGKNVITDKEFESASQRYELACAKLKQAEAEVEYSALQLSYTQITSPIDGVISAIATQKGETVAASFSAPTFFTIIDLNRLELWAYVDETDIGRINRTQKVSFTVDTYPGDIFEGVVETIYPKADIQNNVVNYITVIKINPQGNITQEVSDTDKKNTQPELLAEKTLRPEMTATAEIFTSLKKNVLVLPKKAVLREESFGQSEGGKFYINILTNQDGKIEKRNVNIGISDKKYYEIISGLNEKEKVILVN